MPWFQFTDDFRHEITGAKFKMYRAGRETFVPQDCADEAVLRGKGKIIPRPRGKKVSKSGEVIETPKEPEVTQVFIHEEEPKEPEGEDDGDDEGSQPDTP